MLSPNSDREKQISTNSLVFASGQASLDICLSLLVLDHHLKSVNALVKKYADYVPLSGVRMLDGASNAFMRQQFRTCELEVLLADVRKNKRGTVNSVAPSDMHEWYI